MPSSAATPKRAAGRSGKQICVIGAHLLDPTATGEVQAFVQARVAVRVHDI
jgi:hypothetical protein